MTSEQMTTHYLKQELDQLIRSDPDIFDWLEASSLDGMWYWDLEDMGHEWMSRRFWETLGYNPDEKQHDPDEWQDIIHPEDLKVAQYNFAKHAENPEHPYDQLVRYRHSNGSTVWIRCRGLIIRDPDGKPLRMLGAHTDVTELMQTQLELKQTARSLEESNQLLAMVMRASRIGLFEWQPQSGRLKWNDGLFYQRSDLPETLSPYESWLQHVNPEDREKADAAVRQSGQNHQQVVAEYGMISSDPAGVVMRGVFNYFPSGEGNDRVVGLQIDITEEKKAQQLELEKQSLETRNEELESFAYMASHDLKEPLRALRVFSSSLKRDLESGNQQRIEEDVHFIEQSAARMNELIDSLLTFSRVSNRALEKQPVALKACFEDVLSALQVLIEETGARITTPPDCDILLNIDRVKFNLALQNLLQNGIKFAKNDCDPVVDIGLDQSRKKGYVCISVADNGVGIEPSMHEHIFGIFKRLSATKDRDGTGIGLAVVKKVAERHGGCVELESEPGQGAVFRLYIPVMKGEK